MSHTVGIFVEIVILHQPNFKLETSKSTDISGVWSYRTKTHKSRLIEIRSYQEGSSHMSW